MQFKLILLSGFCLLIMGCSNSKKNSQTPSPAAPTQATAPAPNEAKKADLTTKPVNLAGKSESITCKRDGDVRLLEIEGVQPLGCNLWYTRFGNKDSVASSKKANLHCENVQNRIRKNLEVVDFNCVVGAISQDKIASPAPPLAVQNKTPVSSSITDKKTSASNPTTATTPGKPPVQTESQTK